MKQKNAQPVEKNTLDSTDNPYMVKNLCDLVELIGGELKYLPNSNHSNNL